MVLMLLVLKSPEISKARSSFFGIGTGETLPDKSSEGWIPRPEAILIKVLTVGNVSERSIWPRKAG